MTQGRSYDKLVKYVQDTANLNSIMGLVGWDQQVLMPKKAAEKRGKQMAALNVIIHGKTTSSEYKELLNAAEKELSSLSQKEARNFALLKKSFDQESRIPEELVSKLSEQQSSGYVSWEEARAENDYSKFAPAFQTGLDLGLQYLKLREPGKEAYETALDMFDPNLSSSRVNEIFGSVRERLPGLIQRIADARGRAPTRPACLLGGDDWDVEKQKVMNKELAEKIGFDFTRGRLDVSTHPFTSGFHPADVRITTRYSKDNWVEGISGTIHEVGHGMYEQGLDTSSEFEDTPVAQSLGMAVHESQSLFWERMIFLSKAFWEFATPIFHEHFPHTKEATAEDFYRAVNEVTPSLIRVDADEVTYPLHIILRFEIEQLLVGGKIGVNDVPSTWNSKMKQYLGVDVPSDAKGCLQDIHWSGGMIGYFPSYSLGAMIAAQLYQEGVKKALPNVEELIANGEFEPIKRWLNENVHALGSQPENFDELLLKATGQKLDPQLFLNYLEDKYSAIYKL